MRDGGFRMGIQYKILRIYESRSYLRHPLLLIDKLEEIYFEIKRGRSIGESK